MNIFNESPYAPFVFESLDAKDNSINVIICRGTFDIIDNRLVASDKHTPVVLADVYRDQPLTSSVQIDTDLVPQKLAADVTFNVIAHPPGGRPSDQWQVHVRAGQTSKTLEVFGPRQWTHTLLRGWKLSTPEPTTGVPIHYELAYGGGYSHEDGETVFAANPVGRGYQNPRTVERSETIPGPQVESPGERIAELGGSYTPAGFGPIAKHWLPRRMFCGTADDSWRAERWPLRPVDFDFRYYNSAPSGLVYPGFLRGDEEVQMQGVAADGPLAFALPGVRMSVFALSRSNEITLEKMCLDTLHIDTVAMQVSLTWRLAIPKTSGLQTLQLIPEAW